MDPTPTIFWDPPKTTTGYWDDFWDTLGSGICRASRTWRFARGNWQWTGFLRFSMRPGYVHLSVGGCVRLPGPLSLFVFLRKSTKIGGCLSGTLFHLCLASLVAVFASLCLCLPFASSFAGRGGGIRACLQFLCSTFDSPFLIFCLWVCVLVCILPWYLSSICP